MLGMRGQSCSNPGTVSVSTLRGILEPTLPHYRRLHIAQKYFYLAGAPFIPTLVCVHALMVNSHIFIFRGI